MIGNFIYSTTPRPDDVAVWLERRGRAVGARILLPARLAAMMKEQDYPPPAPSMSIESAMSYGIFLAIRSNAAFVIAGDRSLWREEWGYLTDLGQFQRGPFFARTGDAD